jgi:hypothetical protein
MRYLIIKSCNNCARDKNNDFSLDNSPVNSAELVSSIMAHDDVAIKKILTRNISSQQLKQIFRYALIHSKPDLVKLCIEKNVPVNSVLPFHKKFVLPLDVAQKNADPQIVKFLIEAGAYQKVDEKENANVVNIAENLQYEVGLGGADSENSDL